MGTEITFAFALHATEPDTKRKVEEKSENYPPSDSKIRNYDEAENCHRLTTVDNIACVSTI
jgi:hypothetical protein